MIQHGGRLGGRRRAVPLLAAWSAALGAVVALALVGGRTQEGPDERPRPTDTRLAVPSPQRAERSAAPRADPTITAVEVAAGPMALAAGLGRIWVASASDGMVRAIEPTSVEVDIAVPGLAQPRGGASGRAVGAGQPSLVAVAAGAVWAAGVPDRDEVVRIDPKAGRVVARVSLGAPASGIVGDARGIWVVIADGTLVRIDPATNVVSTSIDAGSTPHAALGATSMWVSSDGRILRVDPISGLQLAVIRGGGGPVAVRDATVWARSLGSVSPQLVAIDESTGTVVERADIATSGRAELGWALPGLEPAALSDEATRYAPRQADFVALAAATWLARPDAGEVWRIERP